MRFAIFASGNGSNFQAIVESVQQQMITGELACLFCDQATAYVVERAKQLGIPYYVLEKTTQHTKSEYESQILAILKQEDIELIVLAGYMKIIGTILLEAYPNRIINLHPSLLPLFPGKQAILDAYNARVSETGITIHVVDDGVDTGPIIYQEALTIKKNESLESLERRIHQLEHQIYPQIIQSYMIKGEHKNVEKVSPIKCVR